MRYRRLFFLPFLVAGCSGGATDLDDPEDISAWANSASALAVYIPAYEPIGIADGHVTPADPACPHVSDEGSTVVIEGGCTNRDGHRWEGTATVSRLASGAFDVMLDGYGSADEGNPLARMTGTFSVEPTADGAHTFEAHYSQEGSPSVAIDYAGTVSGDYETPTTWNGTGTVTRSGHLRANGTATATTRDQRRDGSVCGNESLSGTTTLELDGHTVVITYDGATDCDEASSARYSVDGEDHGTVTGVSCSASPGRSGSPWALACIGAALVVTLRRRSRASRDE